MHRDQYKILLRFLIWGGVAMAGVLRYFDVNPILIEEPQAREAAQEAPRRGSGEVLVAVDSAEIARSAQGGAFGQVDWSYAWLNTVEQELGPHTLMERGELRGADLARFRYVILTHSAASQVVEKDLVGQLRAYVRGGGVLVLERPSAALREVFSADGQGGERGAQSISRVHALGEPWAGQLRQMPLNTRLVGSTGPAVGAVPYLSMDEVPVIYRRAEERGHVITVEFDYGLQLVSLQQGRPEEDFSVVNRYPDTLAPALESNDLVMDPRLLDNRVPYADLLEKYLVHGVMGDARPVVALWPIPQAAQGALLMTHDEEQMGNKADWMARWEQERGARSTYFVIPGEFLDKKGVRGMLSAGADVQLHWNRPQHGQGIFDPVGVWKINPFVRARSLEAQLAEINGFLPRGGKVMANRNHYLLWSGDYTGVFQELGAAGIALDSTYGPDKGCRGYLFGTSLPFWPLDTNGLPLSVQELPFLAAEDLGGVDKAFLWGLFRDSQLGQHQVIHLLYHPNVYRWRPDVSLFDLWLSTYDMAQDTDHVSVTARELYWFWRERRGAALVSSVRLGPAPVPVVPEPPRGAQKAAPRIEDELLRPPDPEAPREAETLLLVVEVHVEGEGHALNVPERIGERALEQALRGKPGGPVAQGADALALKATDVLGMRLRLLPLRKGYHTITFVYR